MVRAVKKLSNELFFREAISFLKENKKIWIPVKGRSMLPFLFTGDKVLLCPTNGYTFRVGDIVLADTDSGIVLHRILSIHNETIYLQGDGNLKRIEKTVVQQIYGYVSLTIKNGKEVSEQSGISMFKARIWRILRPVRRYLLFIYRIFNKKTQTENEA